MLHNCDQCTIVTPQLLPHSLVLSHQCATLLYVPPVCRGSLSRKTTRMSRHAESHPVAWLVWAHRCRGSSNAQHTCKTTNCTETCIIYAVNITPDMHTSCHQCYSCDALPPPHMRWSLLCTTLTLLRPGLDLGWKATAQTTLQTTLQRKGRVIHLHIFRPGFFFPGPPKIEPPPFSSIGPAEELPFPTWTGKAGNSSQWLTTVRREKHKNGPIMSFFWCACKRSQQHFFTHFPCTKWAQIFT